MGGIGERPSCCHLHAGMKVGDEVGSPNSNEQKTTMAQSMELGLAPSLNELCACQVAQQFQNLNPKVRTSIMVSSSYPPNMQTFKGPGGGGWRFRHSWQVTVNGIQLLLVQAVHVSNPQACHGFPRQPWAQAPTQNRGAPHMRGFLLAPLKLETERGPPFETPAMCGHGQNSDALVE